MSVDLDWTQLEFELDKIFLSDTVKDVKKTFKLIKSEGQLKKGLVFGIVYEPDSVDSHGDYCSADVIEKAAHDFLPKAMINLDHEDNSPAVEVVESYIARAAFQLEGTTETVMKGSWVLVTRINDEQLRKDIESGDYTGYSLEGHALFDR